MTPQTALKSKPDEKDIELLDYSSAINQLNVIAKKELEDTKNQIQLANVQLANLKDRIIKDTSTHEQNLRQDKLKFDNEMNLVRNDIIAKQNEVNNHVVQQGRITSDLNTQHQRFESLQQDRIKLNESLMKSESRKIEAEDLFKQAENKMSETLSQVNQVSMNLAKSNEDAEKNKQENIRLTNLSASLETRSKKIEEDNNNLISLKEFVEPKLRTIKDQQDAIEIGKKENDERIAKLQQLIQDEKIQLQDVINKKSELERQMKDFLSQKEEFSRQQVLSQSNK